MATLAINGGTPVRTIPYPSWPQTDDEEYVAAVADVVRSGAWAGSPSPARTAAPSRRGSRPTKGRGTAS